MKLFHIIIFIALYFGTFSSVHACLFPGMMCSMNVDSYKLKIALKKRNVESYKELISKSDSVTYFVTSKNDFSDINKSFTEFGNKIGNENLAIHVDLTKKETNKKNISNFGIISESVCDFHPVFDDFIIFEDRANSECYTFSVDSNGWLLNTLHQISINLGNSENIKKSMQKNNMMHGINFDDTNEAAAQNRWIIEDFIDYLLSKI